MRSLRGWEIGGVEIIFQHLATLFLKNFVPSCLCAFVSKNRVYAPSCFNSFASKRKVQKVQCVQWVQKVEIISQHLANLFLKNFVASCLCDFVTSCQKIAFTRLCAFLFQCLCAFVFQPLNQRSDLNFSYPTSIKK